ncbi:hypothetical protein LDO31_11900 [Luteimonas sp. XNQY3]|nr:hypothetical protein [Luteimonas sp. XNQY3]MCD9006926.1 hypothetical protein [Luteimonas sp. XNQY3]
MSPSPIAIRSYGADSTVDRHDFAQIVLPLAGELAMDLESAHRHRDLRADAAGAAGRAAVSRSARAVGMDVAARRLGRCRAVRLDARQRTLEPHVPAAAADPGRPDDPENLFALVYAVLWERRLPTLLETIAFALVVASVGSCLAAHRNRPAPIATGSIRARITTPDSPPRWH